MLVIQELHFDVWTPLSAAVGGLEAVSPGFAGPWQEGSRRRAHREQRDVTLDLSPIAGGFDTPSHHGADHHGTVMVDNYAGIDRAQPAATTTVRTWVSGIDVNVMEAHGPLLRRIWAECVALPWQLLR